MTVRRRKLTVKQEAFVVAYLSNGRNASAAYRSAYDSENESDRSVQVNARKLLKHTAVSLRVSQFVEKIEAKTLLTVERIEQEVARLAFFDQRGLYREDGTLKPPSEWSDDQAAAISAAEFISKGKKGTLTKLKIWDKGSALTLAARMRGLLKDNITINGGIKVEHKFVFEEIGDNGKVIEGHAIKEPSAA